jgi:hypothetical protein
MFQMNMLPSTLGSKIEEASNKYQATSTVACLLFAWLTVFWDMM